MAEVIFNLNGIQTKIKCDEQDLMKDICQKYSKAGSVDTNNMLLLYRGSKIDPNSKFIDQAKDKDKSKKRLSIICVQLRKNRRSIQLVKKKDVFMARRSVREIKDKNKPIIPLTINDFRKTLIKRIDLNDNPKNNNKIKKANEPPKNDNKKKIVNDPHKNDNNNSNKLEKDLSIFNDFFRTYSCEIDLTNQQDQSTINQLNNNNPPLLENKERNFTENTNIIIDKTLPIRPKKEIESIEKEMNEFEIKFESINNKIKEIINSLNKISENINEFYETTYDKMNNFELVKKDDEAINEIKDIINNYEKFINDINKSIEEKKILDLSENFNKIMSTYKDSKTDIIKYKIKEGDKKVRIFSQNFVLNNWDNCKIICDEKEYPLTEFFDLENYKKNQKILEIKLRIHRDMRDLSFMFSDCSSLISVSKILSWNTEAVISMKGMFAGCSSLVNLPDLSLINTSKVKNFRGIFAGCESLVSLPDISKWNTNNVMDMQYLFNNCYSLKTLPNISTWNTSNVTDMRFMFCNCRSLIALPDISKWNIKKVTNMQGIFEGCSALFSLPNLNKWELGKKVEMRNMFNKCKRCLRIPLKFKKSLTTYNKLEKK